jgi:hypothetical protein
MAVINLHYSEGLLRRAVRAFWWRTLGWKYIAAFFLLLLSFSHSLWTGDRSRWIGLWASGLAIVVAFGVALYLVHYRSVMGRFRKMRVPIATIEFDEEHFRLSSDGGTSELLWAAVKEVWSFPEFILVFLSKAQFFTLPISDFGKEGCDLILAKARAKGAKIAQA